MDRVKEAAIKSAVTSIEKAIEEGLPVEPLARSLGFIQLKGGKTAEIQIKVETNPMEWLKDDPDDQYAEG